MVKAWLVSFDRKRINGCRGMAEIRCEGGALSYIRYTVLGRLYRRHLSDADADRLIAVIDEALRKFNAGEAPETEEK